MDYITAALAAIAEVFKYLTGRKQDNTNDVNHVNTNPTPPKPLPPAKKPLDDKEKDNATN
jgi:hypothetical protein